MTTKTCWLVVLCLWLAACAAIAVPPAPVTADDVAAQFASAMRSRDVAMTAAAALGGDPLPAQLLADGSCTATVAGHLGATRSRDGSWIVQVPATGARIEAVSHGAALNLRGTNTIDVHTAALQLPATVVPGDALVVAAPGSGRGDYWDVPGRSACTEMAAFVFVPYVVTGEDLLRPPAIGDNWLVRYFRSIPIPEARVDGTRLPSAIAVQSLGIDWAAWGASEPTIPYLTALLRRFGGDVYDGWSTDTRTPDHAHPGYGSYYASVVSQACVQLCSTAPPEAKRPLALACVQRGLDLVGAFADGRRQIALGGHCAGRKALVVLAGHLLAVEAFAAPSSIVGPVFQEDLAYGPQAWWCGWQSGWRYSATAPMDGSLLSRPPAEWGSASSPTHSTFGWALSGYLPQVCGAQVGTALGMRLIGRTNEWSAHADAMVQQWMSGPPAGADAQLRAAGLALPWGTDYAVSRGSGFAAAAWRHQ